MIKRVRLRLAFIDKCYKELADYVNAYDQKMFMKRENIADRGIWTAKKRYILNVWDSEGVREKPKLKVMGIESVKSSTPAPCRQMLKDAFDILMTGTEDELIKFIDDSRKKFKSLPPEDISFPDQFQMLRSIDPYLRSMRKARHSLSRCSAFQSLHQRKKTDEQVFVNSEWREDQVLLSDETKSDT